MEKRIVATGDYLLKNLRLILQKTAAILDKPKYYFAELPQSRMYFAGRFGVYCTCPDVFTESDKYLNFGTLIQSWKDRALIMPCEDCAGDVHIYHWSAANYPFQRYNYDGVCLTCGKRIENVSPYLKQETIS
jgi:hypothetical protein